MNHQPIPDPRNDREGQLRLDSTFLPSGPDGAQCEHAVAQITNVLAVDPPGAEVLNEIREPAPHTVEADEAALQCREPMLVLNFGIHSLKNAFDVAAIHRLDGRSKSFHVLLRHRPRSIPQAQESA